MHAEHPILVIDPYEPTRTSIANVLHAAGYAVAPFAYEPAASALEAAWPSLIILELQRTRADAALLQLDRLCHRDATRAIPIIVTSTDTCLLELLAAPLKHLNCRCFAKPFDIELLLVFVSRAVGAASQWSEPVELFEPVGSRIGSAL